MTTAPNMSNPFKIIKMINGEDVICKITEEYSDAFVIEYPMSIVKQKTLDNEHSVVEHTGLQRWINYTHDATVVLHKDRILSVANLAPDVTVYYKHLRKRIKFEDELGPDNETDAMEQMQHNVDRLLKIMGADNIEEDGLEGMEAEITPIDKSKLH